MEVKIANKLYKIRKKEYEGLLEVAKEQVKRGIYAIEKKKYAELRKDECKSITELKGLIRSYKQQGFKVYSNGR